MRKPHISVNDCIIEEVLRTGTAEVDEKVIAIIRESASDYVGGIMRSLREHEYDPLTTKLWFMGGGACLVKNFGNLTDKRIRIIDDIQATVKGYHRLAAKALTKRGEPFEE